jgi:hypothetical protein
MRMSFRGKLLQLQHDVVARWVAVLNGGMGARLAGRTAAAAAGLTGWSDGLIHVLVRRGASTPPKLDGVEVHWTRGEVAVHPWRSRHGSASPRHRYRPAAGCAPIAPPWACLPQVSNSGWCVCMTSTWPWPWTYGEGGLSASRWQTLPAGPKR